MSTTMNKGTTISFNGAPYMVGRPKSGRLHSFDMELVKNKNEVSGAIIATLRTIPYGIEEWDTLINA